jgi:bifunctional non-homologous end joining protein LigD
LVDGEAVIARDDGTPDFHARRSKRRGHEAVLFAFDLIEQYRKDLRDLPLIERKRRLKKLIGKTKTWVRDPVRRMPTSAAIWLRCERPRFQPAIRPRHGGRASGERRLEHPVA